MMSVITATKKAATVPNTITDPDSLNILPPTPKISFCSMFNSREAMVANPVIGIAVPAPAIGQDDRKFQSQ